MNTHPDLLKQIDETITTIRMGNQHAAARYLEALIHKAFVTGFEQGYIAGEERIGDGNKQWEQYQG